MKRILWIGPTLALLCLLTLALHDQGIEAASNSRGLRGVAAAGIEVAALPATARTAPTSLSTPEAPAGAPDAAEAEPQRPSGDAVSITSAPPISDAADAKVKLLVMRAAARKGGWPSWMGVRVFEQYYFPSDSSSSEAIVDYVRAQQKKPLK